MPGTRSPPLSPGLIVGSWQRADDKAVASRAELIVVGGFGPLPPTRAFATVANFEKDGLADLVILPTRRAPELDAARRSVVLGRAGGSKGGRRATEGAAALGERGVPGD